jgi:ABC-type Zn2+ transport system substrate-binding protein/surface adhesin
MSTEENPFAGQGPVLLDIGGDIGALIVTMPAEMNGVEVAIRPKGQHHQPDTHVHYPTHDHHEHDQAHSHDHDHGHQPHVAVVPRPTNGVLVHSLVFPELEQGTYELYLRPAGPVELAVTITGGHVSEATWPSPK